VRSLAKAQVRWRLGALPASEPLLERFLRRQPLLFEPEHAVSFGFLASQEVLKGGYQSRRRSLR
jgi:hypothetical protein